MCWTKLSQGTCQHCALTTILSVLTLSYETDGLLCVWSWYDARQQTNWNLQFTTTEEDCCQNCVLAAQWLPPRCVCSNTENSKPQVQGSPTPTIKFLTLHHATFTPSVHLKRHHAVAGLVMTKKWKKQRIHELGNNLKTSSPMESGSLWNCRETVLKNNRAVMYITLSLWSIKGYCLSCLIYQRTVHVACSVMPTVLAYCRSLQLFDSGDKVLTAIQWTTTCRTTLQIKQNSSAQCDACHHT